MKAPVWLAAMVLVGVGAFHAPPVIVSAQGADEPAEVESAYSNAREVMGSLSELTKDFKDARRPDKEELNGFFAEAWKRMADYIEANPEADDHATIYNWAARRGAYGYGQPAYVRLAQAYLKANEDAEDRKAWEDNLLLARLGAEGETEAAETELKKREEANKDDASKLLEDYTIRLQWYEKADKEDAKAKLIKKIDTADVFAKSDDEWVQRRVHRTIFANSSAEIKDGEKFPDWADLRAVKDIDGKEISIADYKGKVILLDFWAVWCGPCIREMPNVIKLHEETHDKGFEVIGISLDHESGKFDLDAVRNTIAGEGRVGKMPWRQIYDGGGWSTGLSKYYGVTSIPKTVLIDQDGVVVAQGLRGNALDEKVKELLKDAEKPVDR